MLTDHRIICGDTQTVLAGLPAETANLIVTSPPYFRHKDYGVNGQIGLETTVEEYISKLRGVLKELLRVTSETGACFFVVGDTYQRQNLLLVPHRIALAAAEVGWIIRNDLIWSKLDPPPESPRNRWRSGHEHILFLTKRPRKYTFHADAIRVPYADATLKRWGNGQAYGGRKSAGRSNERDSRMQHGKRFTLNANGCLPTDVWSLPSGNSSARHYATFPDRLVRPIILACSNPGDLVLDPFAGSGTTCRVAREEGRRTIGIELNPEYAALAATASNALVEVHSSPSNAGPLISGADA
jgi:site-specific DNA-methyltransferase (adenine-specific)